MAQVRNATPPPRSEAPTRRTGEGVRGARRREMRRPGSRPGQAGTALGNISCEIQREEAPGRRDRPERRRRRRGAGAARARSPSARPPSAPPGPDRNTGGICRGRGWRPRACAPCSRLNHRGLRRASELRVRFQRKVGVPAREPLGQVFIVMPGRCACRRPRGRPRWKSKGPRPRRPRRRRAAKGRPTPLCARRISLMAPGTRASSRPHRASPARIGLPPQGRPERRRVVGERKNARSPCPCPM